MHTESNSTKTINGVILDAESLGADIDLQLLEALPLRWSIYPFSEASEVAERIVDADIVLSNKALLDADAIRGCRQLRLISVLATGVNIVDLDAARESGVCVCNARAYGTNSVVQHCWSLILALTTRLIDYNCAVGEGDWQRSRLFCLQHLPVRQLADKTLGIVGMGTLGSAVADIGKAFGMEIVAACLPGRDTKGRNDYLDWDSFLQRADVISIHCPLSGLSRNLFNSESFAKMKSTSLLINTARGGIVNEDDLKQALLQGDIAGAATDVLTEEPPERGNVLLDSAIPNLIITPHNAWIAQESRQALVAQTAENIRAFLQGDPVRTVS